VVRRGYRESMVLRHAGAFGNKVVRAQETAIKNSGKQMWEGACPRWRCISTR